MFYLTLQAHCRSYFQLWYQVTNQFISIGTLRTILSLKFLHMHKHTHKDILELHLHRTDCLVHYHHI